MKETRFNFRVTETTRLRLKQIVQEWGSRPRLPWQHGRVTATDVVIHLINCEYDAGVKRDKDAGIRIAADARQKTLVKTKKPKVKK